MSILRLRRFTHLLIVDLLQSTIIFNQYFNSIRSISNFREPRVPSNFRSHQALRTTVLTYTSLDYKGSLTIPIKNN